MSVMKYSNNVYKKLIVLALLLCSVLAGISEAVGQTTPWWIKKYFRGYNQKYILYVHKGIFRLYVYDLRMQVVAEYPAGYGSNPDRRAKLYLSDRRTPEGIFRITNVIDKNAHKLSRSFQEWFIMDNLNLRAEDGYYKFRHPEEGMGMHAYGPVVFMLDYPTKNDYGRYYFALKRNWIPRTSNGTPDGIGFGIAIHGQNDADMVGHPSSPGCIVMHNTDVIELGKYAKAGTIVIISRY